MWSCPSRSREQALVCTIALFLSLMLWTLCSPTPRFWEAQHHFFFSEFLEKTWRSATAFLVLMSPIQNRLIEAAPSPNRSHFKSLFLFHEFILVCLCVTVSRREMGRKRDEVILVLHSWKDAYRLHSTNAFIKIPSLAFWTGFWNQYR